ncbi:lipid A deacylase LpxR family protein [Lichenihabitans sp. Uapishka_5]|uniref:lipid A deacylase LpxR family protein n=1 Tax=Lichenihabitans sp. Uapishka_5 TaxID=3037302 RepID=UPI0029E7FD11|nr:lipid A deacylase LpxR family protein [Lichenihabitans sp. Uapishka_5]MDX7953633.1 lipid A deacylase LpxR family protein [Lichenihabitans sp. Uapishka_5]
MLRFTARATVARFVAAALALGLGAAAVSLPPAPAQADEHGRLTFTEENDGLLPDGRDRHYTQGAMITFLSPSVRPEDVTTRLFDGVASVLPIFQSGAGTQRKFAVTVGQTIFTPTRTHDAVPDPTDRPFAGYLFTGGSLMQDTGGTLLETLEVLGGVVGPDSLARQAQEAFHAVAGFNNQNLDQGYRYQLRNEPGFLVTYERKWRLWQTHVAGFEAEVIPEAGLTAGNVMTYAAAGATVRFGQNLGVDYGMERIRPAAGGSAWFDAARLEHDIGWSLFASLQGRAVAHNIFLDGNSVVNSRSVEKNIGVGDVSAGASVFYRDWAKFDVSFTERSKEFRTQQGADHFGQASLAVRF